MLLIIWGIGDLLLPLVDGVVVVGFTLSVILSVGGGVLSVIYRVWKWLKSTIHYTVVATSINILC